MKSKLSGQRGFTLVELVVVIMILGILAATALPKFMNVSTDAHKAAAGGVAGSFGSSVQIAHAQWVVRGNTGTATNVAGFGAGDVDFSSNGWPTDTGGTVANNAIDATSCSRLWSGILQGAPSIGTSASTTAAPVDWCTTATAGATATTGGVCTYVYQKDQATPSCTPATGIRSFTYNVETGVVTVTNN